MGERGSPPEDDGPFERLRGFLRSDEGGAEFARDVTSGVLFVAIVGLLLFGASGVWPPMVAVESPSMTPHLQRGDLVFVVEEHRFGSPNALGGTGVVPYRAGKGMGQAVFGEPGDVIVYRPDGSDRRTPVIHRARFWVNRSENWYGKADPDYVGGGSCEAIPNCPAPHAGFVTKGDANGEYDQVNGISEPVRPSWIRGTAEVRIPYLGYVRLVFG